MARPDRLAELQRERLLIASHLAWLDREIERARSSEDVVIPAASEPPPAVTGGPDIAAIPDEPAPVPSRLGCWLVFAGIMIFGAAVLLTWIYFRYGDTP